MVARAKEGAAGVDGVTFAAIEAAGEEEWLSELRKAARRITVAIGLGLALAANGLLMLFDPAGWYALAPGVPETGLLTHFLAGGFDEIP